MYLGNVYMKDGFIVFNIESAEQKNNSIGLNNNLLDK